MGGNCNRINDHLVANGPLSVALFVTNEWYAYSSGIFGCNIVPSSASNHAVILVGIDASGNFIIQNSWGTTWGASGFITLDKSNACNMCYNDVSYPLIE